MQLRRALLFVFASAWRVYAQVSSPSTDKFIEAVLYADHARHAFQCLDKNPKNPLGEATKWTLRAIATMADFHTTDESRRSEADEFILGQKKDLTMLQRWEDFQQKEGPKRVAAALAKGKLGAAELLVPTEPPPRCEVSLKRVFDLVQQKRVEFDNLVHEGDQMSQTNPESALEKFRSAQGIDRDSRDLQRKIRLVSRK